MPYGERTSRTFDGIEYAPGRRFRVLTQGLKLTGWKPSQFPSAYDGWAQDLRPGDIITCTGFGPGMGSDPGYGVEFMSEESERMHAFHCEIRPQVGGMWNYRPMAGSLETAQELLQ